MVDVSDNQVLRAENIDKMIKAIAQQEFVMKELCMVDSSSSWIETYFTESNTELTANSTRNIKGIPRGAQLPFVQPNWTKQQSIIEKYGAEGIITYESELTSNIPEISRTLLKIGRAVAYAVDNQIYTALWANAGNNVSITFGNGWNSSTLANRDPIYDILRAKREIYIDNLNPDSGNGYLVINPTDYANLLANSKIVNSPTFKQADIITNGNVGKLCGLTIKVSNTISASGALVVLAKECATWKQVTPLTTEVINDPLIKKTIRAVEMGVAQVVVPNAICTIKGTIDS